MNTWPENSRACSGNRHGPGGVPAAVSQPYRHVPCSSPTLIPLSFLLLCPCRLALSHAIFRQRRHHILPHSPTQGIHHRRASGRLGFYMVNTDVRYKHPRARFNTLSQPSTCLQTISIPGTRVLCHEYFPQVHPHSHACV